MAYPHIETKADYTKYESAFQNGVKGLEYLSNGACPGCATCGLPHDCSDDDRDMAEEAHFSYYACDICNRSLGGDRYPAHAYVGDELIHLSICCDCRYYHEYGQLDDMTMLDIERAV